MIDDDRRRFDIPASEDTDPQTASSSVGPEQAFVAALSPFSASAQDLRRRGLAVVPVGGPDGKKPLVSWKSWRRIPGEAFIDALILKYPNANIGVLTGLAKLVVVDCDDADVVPVMIARCGDTPLKVRTPRGGTHLYYRASGERSANLRRSLGLAVDVKASGGFVVLPPSVRPEGPYAGRRYEFEAGSSWDDLVGLPVARAGSLPMARLRSPAPASRLAVEPVGGGGESRIFEGNRNNALFKELAGAARQCDSIADLHKIAEVINANFLPPLPGSEVEKTIDSVWKMKENGSLWEPGVQRVFVSVNEYRNLVVTHNGVDALFLLVTLRLAHSMRGTFSISPESMARNQTIPGWGPARYRKATIALLKNKILALRHRGGAGPGDPSRYSFADGAAVPPA